MLIPLFVYGKIIFYNFKRRKTSLRHKIKNVISFQKKKKIYIFYILCNINACKDF